MTSTKQRHVDVFWKYYSQSTNSLMFDVFPNREAALVVDDPVYTLESSLIYGTLSKLRSQAINGLIREMDKSEPDHVTAKLYIEAINSCDSQQDILLEEIFSEY